MNLSINNDTTRTGEQSAQLGQTANIHAPAPASDAHNLMGGLHWYRSHFRVAIRIILALIVVVCIALAIIAWLILDTPTPKYFAATPDLRLAPLVPLNKPVLTQQGLLNWVSETVTNAISLDFLEWRKKLDAMRDHFDDEAYKSFLESLKHSGILEMIREKRLSASAVATNAPIIVASGEVGGIATWRIEFPIIVSYESSQGVESTQHLLATVLVRRASTVKTPRGVVIQQIVLKRES